ncbi:CPBP family glutamic-type intramembrane protease [Lacinutrix sp. MEBiC02404]
MKTIVKYIRTHLKEDYKTATYLIFLLFLSVFIYIHHVTNFAVNFLSNNINSPLLVLSYFLFFGFAYYTTIAIIVFTKSDYSFIKSSGFWFTSIFAILLVSLRLGFLEHYKWIYENIAPEKAFFYTKIAARAMRTIIFSFGILFFYYLFEKYNTNFYGFSTKNVSWKPYFLLLLIVIPFIGIASFQPSFLNQYPLIGNTGNAINKLHALAIYEPVYLLDFISIEWFFRGFLVLSMVKILGSKAILPMVALYVFFHIGKPTGEIIGSIFGGYLLGIISLHSRSIIGGIIIHMGVAFLMDLMAIIQKFDIYF